MTEPEDKTICPHCRQKLMKWCNPDVSSWGYGYQLVCFNNDCPYYVKGWDWMRERYQQKASYRYRYNPQNDEHGPLPVWSEDALRGSIIEDEEE